MPQENDVDVIVVGAGNAAMCAALAARERGARVIVLESAPQEERGGNSTYTAGAMRFAYNGIDEYMEVVGELTPPYTPRWNGKVERFHQTMEREWAKGVRYRNSTARNQALPHWLRYYNERRPHSSLGNRPPISRAHNLSGQDI